MKTNKILAMAAAIAGLAGSAMIEARPVAAATVCKARMDGQGSGMGIAGQGSALARSNALSDWSAKVQAKYGSQFANTATARSVKYDCRQGAILEAKCAVSAVPCADVVTKKPSKKKRR